VLTRTRKEEIISQLTAVMQEDRTIFVVESKGVDVATLTALRLNLRSAGSSMQMVKNTLASRAVKDTAYESLMPFFKGVSVLLVGSDSLGMAKAVQTFMKDHEGAISYKGGVMDGADVSLEMLKALASIPPLEQLRAELVGVLAAPAAEIVRVLKAKPQAVVSVLSNRVEKGE